MNGNEVFRFEVPYHFPLRPRPSFPDSGTVKEFSYHLHIQLLSFYLPGRQIVIPFRAAVKPMGYLSLFLLNKLVRLLLDH